jgi:ABC-2 type transport system permease protein
MTTAVTDADANIEHSRHYALRLVVHQCGADLRCFRRNKQSVFFTLALPILFLLILGSVFQHQNLVVANGRIDEPVYYVPGMIAFGVISATFSNLVVSVVGYREAGIYKRRRTTPVPAWAIIAGRSLVAAGSAVANTVVLLAIGWAAFGAHIPARTAPAFLLDIVVGALAFGCLGFALTSLVKAADAAQPVVLAIVLPLYFISGVFIPTPLLPHWLIDIGTVFPVHALADALVAVYNPHLAGSGLDWSDLGVLVVWGIVALAFANRRFSWLPQST